MKQFARKTAILIPFSIMLLSCDKSPKTQTIIDESGATHTQAQPFKGETYRTADDRSSVTLISPTELEFRTSEGPTLLSTYTKQNDALRIVFTKLGTNEVKYFHFTPEGIRSDDGRIFFAPEPLQIAQSQRRLEAERLAQQLAEQRAAQQLAAEQQLAQQKAYKMKMRTPSKQIETIGGITITDTDVRGNGFVVWYGSVTGVGYRPLSNEIIDIGFWNHGYMAQPVTFSKQGERDKFIVTVDKAVKAWRATYPDAVSGEFQYIK